MTQPARIFSGDHTSGRSGWEEAQIVALLRCADDVWILGACCADMREAGIVEPRLRSGWKGRVWTLKKPSIIRESIAEAKYWR